MSLVPVSTPFNIDLEFEVAPFQKRLLAYAIDLTILIIFSRIMVFVLSDIVFTAGQSNMYFALSIFFVCIPMALYNPLMEILYHGQSLGKKIVGIRVISLEGGEPNLGQYIVRSIFRVWEWVLYFGIMLNNSEYFFYFQIIPTLILGIIVIIIIAVSKNSQRLGDMAAGTAIVEATTKLSLDDTIFRVVTTNEYKVHFPQVMKLSDRDINTIKNVIKMAEKSGRYDTAERVGQRIKDVLNIETNFEIYHFLETLMNDYNYLATKE
jgi:uncharacterized RDD family membrane protein YckC